jgi:hypothetical protein
MKDWTRQEKIMVISYVISLIAGLIFIVEIAKMS